MNILLKSVLCSIGCVTLQTFMGSGGGYRAVVTTWLYYPANLLIYRWRVLHPSMVTSALIQWLVWFALFVAVFAGTRALEKALQRRKPLGFGNYFACALGVQFIVLSFPWDRAGSLVRGIGFLYYPALRLDHSLNMEANIGAPFLWVGPATIVYALLFASVATLMGQYRAAQPGASPNGGPVAPVGNSGATSGPPSVS